MKVTRNENLQLQMQDYAINHYAIRPTDPVCVLANVLIITDV